MERFIGEKAQEMPASPAKKRIVKKTTKSLQSEDNGPMVYECVDLFEEDVDFASCNSLMKSVDGELNGMRSEVDKIRLKVQYSLDDEGPYSHLDVSLQGVISSDPIDARFCMLSFFCQIERLIKVWMPKLKRQEV